LFSPPNFWSYSSLGEKATEKKITKIKKKREIKVTWKFSHLHTQSIAENIINNYSISVLYTNTSAAIFETQCRYADSALTVRRLDELSVLTQYLFHNISSNLLSSEDLKYDTSNA